MIILNTLTLTYHFFRLKGVKSLKSKIDEKSKDFKENLNQVLTITDGKDFDHLSDKSKESINDIIKMYDDITYLSLFNITYYSSMVVVSLFLAIITLISMAIFGVAFGPIIKIVVGIEIMICLYEFYMGMKEKGANK